MKVKATLTSIEIAERGGHLDLRGFVEVGAVRLGFHHHDVVFSGEKWSRAIEEVEAFVAERVARELEKEVKQ